MFFSAPRSAFSIFLKSPQRMYIGFRNSTSRCGYRWFSEISGNFVRISYNWWCVLYQKREKSISFPQYSDNFVEGIHLLGQFFETERIITACEKFLIYKSKKSIRKLFELSNEFHLKKLNVSDFYVMLSEKIDFFRRGALKKSKHRRIFVSCFHRTFWPFIILQ